MLTIKRVGLAGGAVALAVLSVLLASPRANAATVSDIGAAIVVWPKIAAETGVTDTTVQLMNLDRTSQTAAHCFYVNANSHCTNSGDVCTSSLHCIDGEFRGACVPGWVETNFDIILTPNQPLAWNALDGLGGSDIPCPGTFGSKCTGNQGTRVPPITESPFIGELKCIQVDRITRLPVECGGGGQPACENDLAGSATVIDISEGQVDPKTYNAVGLRTAGANDGDGTLNLGDPDGTGGPENAEYEPCAEVLILNHLFDGAEDPISESYTASSELTLVPCTEDFVAQSTPPVTAQFLVYNEFEQRFSTSRTVRCLLDSELSRIDTSQPDRSIFNASVAGTVAGQTRIRGVGGGLLGSALLSFCATADCDALKAGAGYNLNGFADRSDGDVNRIP